MEDLQNSCTGAYTQNARAAITVGTPAEHDKQLNDLRKRMNKNLRDQSGRLHHPMNRAQSFSRSIGLQREFGMLEVNLAAVAVLFAVRCLACKHAVFMRVAASTVEPKFDRRCRFGVCNRRSERIRESYSCASCFF